MTTQYDQYGTFALGAETDVEKSGRYAFMAGCESTIVGELLNKMELCQQDSLLEIGFGSGLLLEPLSNYVGSAHGVDHPNFVDCFTQKYPESKVELKAGNFLTTPLPRLGKFSKILIYSVVHCLQQREDVMNFVFRATTLLKPGGLMLIGDIPNASAKSRFLATREGREVQRHWSVRVLEEGGKQPGLEEEPFDSVIFDDRFLCDILLKIRSEGHDAFLLPQGRDLPFSQSREDILVRAR